MFAGKPIIGIVGGIGSGKSFIADLFGEMGCLVIHSDELAKAAYNDAGVRDKLADWWGPSVLKPSGEVDRKALAAIIFNDLDSRRRLEGLLHPIVNQRRQELMAQAATDPGVSAYIWDTPLLLETGLQSQCDAVVFVNAPEALRLARVAKSRSWNAAELQRRENLQLPLDKKREISEYVIENTADADYARGQVTDVFSRIRHRRAGPLS